MAKSIARTLYIIIKTINYTLRFRQAAKCKTYIPLTPNGIKTKQIE